MKANASSSGSVTRVADATADRTSTNIFMSALMLTVAGFVTWHWRLKWNFNPDSSDFNPIIVVPLVFGPIGLRFLVPAVTGILRQRRFGKSVLEIAGAKVQMDSTLRGQVVTSVAIHPQSDFEITLRCIEAFSVRSNDTDTSITKTIEHVRWESTVHVPAATVSTEGIPFEIALPPPFPSPLAPEHDPSLIVRGVISLNFPGGRKIYAHRQRPDSTHWMLFIKAPLQGVDYQASFLVNVESPTPPVRKRR